MVTIGEAPPLLLLLHLTPLRLIMVIGMILLMDHIPHVTFLSTQTLVPAVYTSESFLVRPGGVSLSEGVRHRVYAGRLLRRRILLGHVAFFLLVVWLCLG